MQRLQKERDSFQEEMEKLHERIEFQQNQMTKVQREKENVLSELDLVKDRWEKAHTFAAEVERELCDNRGVVLQSTK